jgi:hypothetical protein
MTREKTIASLVYFKKQNIRHFIKHRFLYLQPLFFVFVNNKNLAGRHVKLAPLFLSVSYLIKL